MYFLFSKYMRPRLKHAPVHGSAATMDPLLPTCAQAGGAHLARVPGTHNGFTTRSRRHTCERKKAPISVDTRAFNRRADSVFHQDIGNSSLKT